MPGASWRVTHGGDPTDDPVLMQAGVERAHGVVFALENDQDNVLGVLTARRLAPDARIIASTESAATGEKLRTAGANAVVSPSRIGGLRIASELIRPKVVSFLDQMLREKGGTLRVKEVIIPERAQAAGKGLASLDVGSIEGTILLAARREDGGFEFRPGPETMLEPGMALIVMADLEGRSRLEQRLAG